MNVPTFKKLSIEVGLMEHYFSRRQNVEHDIVEVIITFDMHRFTFKTDSGVFSKGKLDKGTHLLLTAIPKMGSGKILDIGCGWGAIGIILGKSNPDAFVHLSDVNKRALSLAKQNAKQNEVKITLHNSDIFDFIEDTFDLIATNPPIRAGKKVVYSIVEQSFAHLNKNGSFYAVVRTKQGAKSFGKEVESVFGNVEIVARSGGYKVFKAVKVC